MPMGRDREWQAGVGLFIATQALAGGGGTHRQAQDAPPPPHSQTLLGKKILPRPLRGRTGRRRRKKSFARSSRRRSNESAIRRSNRPFHPAFKSPPAPVTCYFFINSLKLAFTFAVLFSGNRIRQPGDALVASDQQGPSLGHFSTVELSRSLAQSCRFKKHLTTDERDERR